MLHLKQVGKGNGGDMARIRLSASETKEIPAPTPGKTKQVQGPNAYVQIEKRESPVHLEKARSTPLLGTHERCDLQP